MGKSRKQKAKKNVAEKDSEDSGLKVKIILSPKREEEDEDMSDEYETTMISPSRTKGKSKVQKTTKTPKGFESEKSSKSTKRKQSFGKLEEEVGGSPPKKSKSASSQIVVKIPSGKGAMKADESKLSPGSKKVFELLSHETSSVGSSSSFLGEKRKEKDKKKKKKEKEKKKKLFSSKSDKNRFLNVRRSSDEEGEGWIPEKVSEKKSKDDGDYYMWEKPYEKVHVPHKEISIEMSEESQDLWKKKKLKSKSSSKSSKKRKHEKKMRKMLQLQRKKDKETLTREQIIKIQQRLLMHGMKSPTHMGGDLDLNFSSHGEDLISQLTSASECYDPTSFLLDSGVEENVEKTQIEVKKVIKKPDKAKPVGKDAKDIKKKKPVISAYMLWCKANRAKVVTENPHYKFADISKRLGEMWSNLPEKEKTRWRNQRRTLIMMKHKNVPALSRLKKQTKGAKPKNQIKVPPPKTEPIDVAAHLKLLGDSLSNVGQSLINHAGGQTEVHGSMSVLLDSMLSALCPLICLTSEVDETNVLPKKMQSGMLENISYIMPGL